MKNIWSKNLKLRLVVGLTGGPIIFFSAIYNSLVFAISIFLITLLCLKEVYNIGKYFDIRSHYLTGYLFSVFFILNIYFSEGDYSFLILISFAMILSLQTIFIKKQDPFLYIYFVYFWTVYITCFLGSLILIRNNSSYPPDYTGRLVGMILLAVWSLDTFAYFGGKLFGKHKLYPRISPKKTIEGSIIGTVFALLIVISYRYIWFSTFSLFHTIIIIVIVSIFGQIGDLIESLIKRRAGIKDSSNNLPGHGGIFDRFDSLIFCAPFVYIYIKFFILI